MLFGNNCMRGVTQPYICPGPSCPPPPPPKPRPTIATLAECVAKAARCKDANFVSFSPKQRDCGWYKSCDFTSAALRRYAGNGTDYQSQVLHSVSSGTVGAPPAGTTAVGCCGYVQHRVLCRAVLCCILLNTTAWLCSRILEGADEGAPTIPPSCPVRWCTRTQGPPLL